MCVIKERGGWWNGVKVIYRKRGHASAVCTRFTVIIQLSIIIIIN
jgi:hypothetical protein